MYRAKDFIATSQDLIFAVVAGGGENGVIRCFLRYAPGDGGWRKLSSDQANQYLATHYPQYLFHSLRLDADMHGVPESAVVRHYQPQAVLQTLLHSRDDDPVLNDLRQLCELLRRQGVDLSQLGVTGSLLPGFQHPGSDIDLVCYSRPLFQTLRRAVQTLTDSGQCRTLTARDWLQAYSRRDCELTLEEYIRHEQRKFNKGVINGRKFDLSLVNEPADDDRQFAKLGPIRIETTVTNASRGFDYPAEYGIDAADIASVVSFTATYAGQAQTGERIEVSGQLEVDEQGQKRIVVGSSREAPGEYIRSVN
ncbi:MAG: hypothetical protein PHW13_11290 [Methylococcales bacterium]|nr:hypothetical protein [Methylococcales bacterium]